MSQLLVSENVFNFEVEACLQDAPNPQRANESEIPRLWEGAAVDGMNIHSAVVRWWNQRSPSHGHIWRREGVVIWWCWWSRGILCESLVRGIPRSDLCRCRHIISVTLRDRHVAGNFLPRKSSRARDKTVVAMDNCHSHRHLDDGRNVAREVSADSSCCSEDLDRKGSQ